jgi:hypothetical protein
MVSFTSSPCIPTSLAYSVGSTPLHIQLVQLDTKNCVYIKDTQMTRSHYRIMLAWVIHALCRFSDISFTYSKCVIASKSHLRNPGVMQWTRHNQFGWTSCQVANIAPGTVGAIDIYLFYHEQHCVVFKSALLRIVDLHPLYQDKLLCISPHCQVIVISQCLFRPYATLKSMFSLLAQAPLGSCARMLWQMREWTFGSSIKGQSIDPLHSCFLTWLYARAFKLTTGQGDGLSPRTIEVLQVKMLPCWLTKTWCSQTWHRVMDLQSAF